MRARCVPVDVCLPMIIRSLRPPQQLLLQTESAPSEIVSAILQLVAVIHEGTAVEDCN